MSDQKNKYPVNLTETAFPMRGDLAKRELAKSDLAKRDLAEAGLSAEKLDGGGVDPAVARSHDAPAVSS